MPRSSNEAARSARGHAVLKTGRVAAMRYGVIKDGATKGMITKVRRLAGTMRKNQRDIIIC